MAWLVFAGGEFIGHIMVFASQRHASIQKANVKTVNWDGVVAASAEDEAALKMWEVRYADMRKANPWAASTSADALQTEIANLEGDALFKRSKSCADVTKPDSRAFCDRYAAVKVRLGNIKDINKAAEQIEATKRKLDSTREKLRQTDKGFSEAGAQVDVVAILTSMSLSPSGGHKQASNIGLEVFIAFLFTIGPMTLLKVAMMDWSAPAPNGKRRLARFIAWAKAMLNGEKPAALIADTVASAIPDGAPTVPPVEQRFAPPPSAVDRVIERATTVVRDNSIWRDLNRALRAA
jgi:hypothetical protein